MLLLTLLVVLFGPLMVFALLKLVLPGRLRDTEKPPKLIRTVCGSGYQLAASVVAGNAH